MVRAVIELVVVASCFALSTVSPAAAQAPDGTMKITGRRVAEGIEPSWGEGILIYQGRDYPFTFKATGLFRDVNANMTAAELSGRVFNLKNLDDFAGDYQHVEAKGR